MRGLNFKGDHRSRFVNRNKQSFRHRKSVAGINNGARLRTNADRAHQRLGWQAAAFGKKMQMEVAEDLNRVDPCFQVAAFVAEKSGAGAGCAEKFPRTGGTG